MPYEITLNHLPAGYAGSCGRAGDEIDLVFREFTSTEDGQHFISRLEGATIEILEKISPDAGIAASQTNHLLAVIRSDKTATVYWNELSPTLEVRPKSDVKKGETVFLDHILDVERVKFPSSVIPDENVCIVYVFSSGWRKGLFFDYGPIQLEERRRPRDYDLGLTLGYCLSKLWFQHLFAITDETWNELFKQGWFPFSHLSSQVVKNMVTRAAHAVPIDDHLQEIAAEVTKAMPAHLTAWRKVDIFTPHLEFIQRAFDRFEEGDDISAASILYPRLEGIMRMLGAVEHSGKAVTQSDLAQLASGHARIREESLLLPRRFESYLRTIYFANFEPGKIVDSVSRNTVSHGVVSTLNNKAVVIGFLILLQISSVVAITSSKAHTDQATSEQ